MSPLDASGARMLAAMILFRSAALAYGQQAVGPAV